MCDFFHSTYHNLKGIQISCIHHTGSIQVRLWRAAWARGEHSRPSIQKARIRAPPSPYNYFFRLIYVQYVFLFLIGNEMFDEISVGDQLGLNPWPSACQANAVTIRATEPVILNIWILCMIFCLLSKMSSFFSFFLQNLSNFDFSNSFHEFLLSFQDEQFFIFF